jgi:hypothetical protein
MCLRGYVILLPPAFSSDTGRNSNYIHLVTLKSKGRTLGQSCIVVSTRFQDRRDTSNSTQQLPRRLLQNTSDRALVGGIQGRISRRIENETRVGRRYFGLPDSVVVHALDLTIRLNIEEESVIEKIVGSETQGFRKVHISIDLQHPIFEVTRVGLELVDTAWCGAGTR